MKEELLWTLLTVVGLLGAVVFGYALRRMHGIIAKRDARYVCPFLRFGKTALSQPSLPLFVQFRQLYLLGLVEAAIVLLVAGHNTAVWPWLEKTMMVLCGLSWLAAEAEALLLPKREEAAGVLSWIKWILLIAWVIGLFVGLVTRGWALSV